ncbi:MAG: hypothetical protein JWQ08_841, partial [Deinococcus sp.]|nr:hypothetical protein [Deinococcus sp.]
PQGLAGLWMKAQARRELAAVTGKKGAERA